MNSGETEIMEAQNQMLHQPEFCTILDRFFFDTEQQRRFYAKANNAHVLYDFCFQLVFH